MVCHPRLPLVAGVNSADPVVRVWDSDAGGLRVLETIGADSPPYDDVHVGRRTPAVAWHPDRALLLVADERAVVMWTPDGVDELDDLPATAAYRWLGFSPDGEGLWAAPSSGDEHKPWELSSDVLDPYSGTVHPGPGWHTGIAAHPSGEVVATLHGDDIDGTSVVFARVDDGTAPTTMRLLERTLDLEVDNYETPIFSADGRHLAIRGHNDNSLDVVGFPSLQHVLRTILDQRGNPLPTHPGPRHDIAFGTRPGVLWLGTTAGILVEIDLDEQRTTGHDVLDGHPVTALAATPAGELVVATAHGDLVLLSVRTDPDRDRAPDDDAVRATATSFLDTTSEVPDDGGPEAPWVVRDDAPNWVSDGLATATEPAWLRLQAAIDNPRGQGG
ncbi:hypothetical protein BLA60_22860 [Actinophytocola xinjiangensis]|uniref:WD40 repeat protein n=1 Tax=Actinophytocola xinjiangensis TaxID=485602 RepID=A0A7Z0WJQ7_9PSEU|nr:hypothetical protein BLA60_22860 [Actinophytocola xinjiangensis]